MERVLEDHGLVVDIDRDGVLTITNQANPDSSVRVSRRNGLLAVVTDGEFIPFALEGNQPAMLMGKMRPRRQAAEVIPLHTAAAQ